MTTVPNLDGSLYEVTVQQDPETGDLIIPIPPEVLQRLEWKEGDQITIDRDENGKMVVSLFKK
jgi:hypothetical protein